ncbi:hypothetical protein MKX01_035424 [Papaver californicum]|nr:hypothetical protein MKX01_035424 [Papaver californicum]
MESTAGTATTPTTITPLKDETTQESVQEEPSKSRIPLAGGGEVGVVVTLNENDEDVHATMAQTLPKFVIFQSNRNNLYLHIDKENPNVPNALRFEGSYSFGLETRFEVVPATTGTGLIHIRCLQNNKYWTNLDGTKDSLVTAMAVKPMENQSDKQCTLFQPIFLYPDNNRIISLRHVSTGYYVAFFMGNDKCYGLLCLSQFPDVDYDVCTLLDWESIVVLPDLIRIHGDNGNHLKALEDGYMDYNIKADDSSLFDYEVSASIFGGIRLKNVAFHKYWTHMDDSDWVLLKQAEADTTYHDTKTVFLPTKIDGNRIIMRCLKNSLFCNRYTAEAENKRSCLATLNNYPDEFSTMEIEEPVVSRKIDNVRYHHSDSRLYNEKKSVALISDDSSNKTQHPITTQLDLKTTVSNTTNWSTSISLKMGVKMNITSGVPFIESGEIQISGDVTKSYEWGETVTESLELGCVKTITVAPMTRLKASLIATRLSYDIPFSYMQCDVLKNGSTKVTEKNDGICTGHNGYDYKYEVVSHPLDDDEDDD